MSGSTLCIGIIPAYAGYTCPRNIGAWQGKDHPRIRGVHPPHYVLAYIMKGSSPHTRGTPSNVRPNSLRRRIIPAYAGYTLGLTLEEVAQRDHPRIRGVHPGNGQAQARFPGSSPHTRGTQRRFDFLVARVRIIPAYAGYTPGRDGKL